MYVPFATSPFVLSTATGIFVRVFFEVRTFLPGSRISRTRNAGSLYRNIAGFELERTANSSQPALQIRYPPRKWRRSHGDVASTKTKNFIAICQSTRPMRDTDQCKAEGS